MLIFRDGRWTRRTEAVFFRETAFLFDIAVFLGSVPLADPAHLPVKRYQILISDKDHPFLLAFGTGLGYTSYQSGPTKSHIYPAGRYRT